MQNTYYFGAGPATLPSAVLETIRDEILDYNSTGLSVLELGHRGDEFREIRDHAEVLLRALMEIPDDYSVLFMHGGATSQYSMLPLNFLGPEKTADYICTGLWSRKAFDEAKIFAQVSEIDALHTDGVLSIKPTQTWKLNPKASYVHYCDNETITGVAFNQTPESQGIHLMCDMTSSILSRPVEVKRYGLIYASAQKNLGIAGLCVVIVNNNLLERCNKNVPRLYDYKRCAEGASLINTPPTFAIYVLRILLEWVKAQGGVEEMHKRGKENAALMYHVIDTSELYSSKVSIECRSNINIPFSIQVKEVQDSFLLEAEKNKLLGLRGHKSVGGVRASLYNAVPHAGVKALVDFMQEFELKL